MSSNTEQIKERLNIVDVLSGYIKVEKAGINFKAKCPFHNEKTPSFFISPARQSYYCFGCGEKGDIFSFVQKFEGLDFKGALKTLADKAGVELKNFKNEDQAEKDEKEELFEIMESATKFYEENLAANNFALEYLTKRGLAKETITKWRLGFAKDEWRNLFDYLIQKGFSREKMLEAGLSKKVLNEQKYYDTFRNRVMFPICDNTGRVIAFSGRSMKEDEKTPKYLNSPETKLFYKSEVLYGFDIAKNYIRKLDYAVLVEGQMDLLMSHQSDVFNTVASSGTALTQQHLLKIQRLTNRVIIAYDSDSAGEKASLRAAELALSLGMEVKIASLPKGEDPASIAKENPEQWKNSLKNSEHFLDFVLNKTIKENLGKNIAREITKKVLPLVPLIKSEMEKNQFVKKIANKANINEESVWNDLKKIKTEEIKDGETNHKQTKITNLERIMAGIIFLEESTPNGKNKWKEKWQKIGGLEAIEEILNEYKSEKEELIFEAERNSIGENPEKGYDEVLRRLELQFLKQKLQNTAKLLDQKNISQTEDKEFREDLERIQKRIKEINI